MMYALRRKKSTLPGAGDGVFAADFIPKGETFLVEDVLVLTDPIVCESILLGYVYDWGLDVVGLVLGFGSLFNHSLSPNAKYRPLSKSMKYIARRDIEPGEEIFINYNGNPKDQSEWEFV